MRVRLVKSAMRITPSRVSLNVHSLTSALHPLIRIREAFQLQTSLLCSDEEDVEERDLDEEEERSKLVVLIEQ